MLYLGKQKAVDANEAAIKGPKLQVLECHQSPPKMPNLMLPQTRFYLDRAVEGTLKGRWIVWIIVPTVSRACQSPYWG